uniref:C-type lectin domain-containing protein n=1 Tax=Kryptolebias marmoratus TaxID=37003 RepID=A0A3Q3GCK9_KRYMA
MRRILSALILSGLCLIYLSLENPKFSFSLSPPLISGTQLYPEFVSVNETMTWSNAQTFCRENFIDLATVKNVTENEMAQSLVPPEDYLWIGLFREPYFNWSDGNSTLFSNWDSVLNPISSMAVICSVTSVQRSGKWSFKSCEEKLPFVCYGPCCGEYCKTTT